MNNFLYVFDAFFSTSCDLYSQCGPCFSEKNEVYRVLLQRSQYCTHISVHSKKAFKFLLKINGYIDRTLIVSHFFVSCFDTNGQCQPIFK